MTLPADPCLPGDPPIPLTLRRHARARRITLRIAQTDGRVTLTLPPRLPLAEAMRFARSKEAWIRSHLAARAADVTVGHGALVPLAGTPMRVVAGPGRRVQVADGEIAVPGTPGRAGRTLATWLRGIARDRLVEACDDYAAMLGRPYARITLRDTRSRWGSCTSQGALMFSWRLVMAPPEILAYVAAHEVAHLAQMNHSGAFWDEVARLYGPHATARAWLRREGAGLHRYRFAATN